MNLNYLECFVSLSETLSFTKTAKDFSVSQPSISRQIRLLEEQLNQKLFIRDKHKVHLTEEGLKFKAKIRPLMSEIQNVMANTKDRAQKASGTLHIGCLSEIGQYAIMQAILGFHQEHREIFFDVVFSDYKQIIEKVKLGQLDFGILGQAIDLENIRAYELMEERAVLVTRYNNKQDIGDIHDCEFVTYLKYDVLLANYLQKFFKRIPYGKLKRPISVNSHKSMIEALHDNDYYAVIPYFSVEKEIQEKSLRIVSENELKNHLYLIHMENPLMPQKNDLFKKHIMEWSRKRNL